MKKESPSSGELLISLPELIAVMRRRKMLIGAYVIAAAMAGVLYAVLATPLYTATITVQPTAGEEGALSGLANRLSGAAALAGIKLEGTDSSRSAYIAILQSRELAERFIEEHNLKPLLFPDEWDATKESWRREGGEKRGVMAAISRFIAYLSKDEGWQAEVSPEPTAWQAYKVFDGEIRTVQEDRQTGLVSVSFEFRNPKLAAEWANAYLALANAEIRADAVREAQRALQHLYAEAEKTNIAGIRDTIYTLIQNQLEKIVLANAREEYAFRVIDKAVIPEERSHPKRALIVALSIIVGGMLGFFNALLIEARRGTLLVENSSRSPVAWRP